MASKKKPTFLRRKDGLYLKQAGIKGRGVFCVTDIKAGEILEVTPAIILRESDTNHVDKTILENYTFEIGTVSKKMRQSVRLKKTGDCSCVLMGIVSFCNHGEKPNAEVEWEEKGDTVYYILKAIRNIPKNTEICTTYGDTWFNDRS